MPIITRYSLEQYNQAIELKAQGYGSQRIAKILGLSRRGAVEDWINKGRKPYDFSEKRIAACNSKENVERMNKITQPNAVKISAELRIKRLPESAKEVTEDLGYILGTVYGDGHVTTKQRRVILSVTDKEFSLEFKRVLEKWSGFKARFFPRKLKPDKYVKKRKLQYVVYIDSKEASEFLDNFDLNNFKKANEKIKGAFLRGFFDSESSAHKKRGLSCYNTDYSLILISKELLNSLGITLTIQCRKTNLGRFNSVKPCYKLYIAKKESIIKFYDHVGFTIHRKQQRLIDQVNEMI
jgi:intein-encoded DNA endonuclease-like protein